MKRKLSLVLSIILMFQVNLVNGAEEISFWAVDEVTAAITEGLVPTNLQSGFQHDITRAEYVILALELLELGNRAVLENVSHPFTDVNGHQFETEIIYAYNAGIIKGDGKGLFRPDDSITREEIASLVCHLVLALESDADITREQYITFYDRSDISFWALTYIEYCYQNNIMKGVGEIDELDIMNPKGQATNEQAIILLYRLAKEHELMAVYKLPEVEIISYDHLGNEILVDSDNINGFVNSTTLNTGKLLSFYGNLDEYSIKALEDHYFSLIHEVLGTISLYEDDSVVNITLSTTTAEETDIMKAFTNFAEIYTDTEQIEIALERSYVMFENSTMDTFEKLLVDNGSIEFEYNHITNHYVYKIVLDKRL